MKRGGFFATLLRVIQHMQNTLKNSLRENSCIYIQEKKTPSLGECIKMILPIINGRIFHINS